MFRTWWPLAVICTATFMYLLDVTIVVVALPDIQRSLSAGFDQLQWVTDAYALALAALLLTSGSLADRWGRRLIFAVGLTIFTAASLLCGIAPNAEMLIASRALQGVGGAMLFATSLALLAVNYHGRRRGVAFGVWGAVVGVATALGPILGGVITSGWSWRGIFLVNVPIGIAALVATKILAESKAEHPRRIDVPGLLTLTVGLLALVFGFIETGNHAWGSTTVVTSLVVAAISLAAFVAVERYVTEPMFDLGLLRIPTFVGGSIAAFAMNGSLFAVLLYIAVYLQNSLGYSTLEAGLRVAIVSGATMVVATISGRAVASVPTRWLIGPGLLLVAIGLGVSAGLTGSSSWIHLLAGFIIAGAGAGLVNPPLASTAIGVVDLHRSGMASGVNGTFRQVGIAVGIAVYGSLFAARVRSSMQAGLQSLPHGREIAPHLADSLRSGGFDRALASAPTTQRAQIAHAANDAFASGMNVIFYTSAGVALVGAVAALLLIRSRDFVAHQPPATMSSTT